MAETPDSSPNPSASLSAKEKSALGFDTRITRRDFLGASLLGAGGALLGMAAPGLMRNAQAQTVPVPLTGLTREWSGWRSDAGIGIGDYARANGNTWNVVNDAKAALRNREMDGLIAGAADSGESYDLIVVGCGIAGLSAAHVYHKERPGSSVLMLDQHAIFGGEAKQNEIEVDGTRLIGPQGSTGMVFPLQRAKAFGFYSGFYEELGFPEAFDFQEPQNLRSDMLIPRDVWSPMHIGWEQSDIGYFFEGQGFVKNAWHNGWKDAPLPEAQKQDLTRLELSHTAPRRTDWAQWLDSMTYRDYLSKVMGLGPEVSKYIDPVAAAMGCGQGADTISAFSAYNFMQPGVVNYNRDPAQGKGDGTDDLYLVSFPGGNATIARRLVKYLIPDAFAGERLSELILGKLNWNALDRANQPVRIRLSSTVVAVSHDGPADSAKGVTVTWLREGRLYKARARAVIMAGQQHANKYVCRDLPRAYYEAMATFHHAPMLTVNVALRNWRFLDKLGIASARWFEGFGWWTSLRRNVLVDGRETMPLDPDKPAMMVQYNPFIVNGLNDVAQTCTAARMQLFHLPYADIEAGVRSQFQKMFGAAGFDARRDIAGIVANRWGHAYVTAQPGFFFGKDGQPAPREIIRTRFNRMAFCHAELTGAQMWETAAEEGDRAAKQILEII
ncbi:NAD(P)-binding protein [Azoarcus indigens]|uniref:Secreted protein n=1 Tax=Azoarcus indigens TaxID=29545 RepID=A0A4R6ED39_9RHOO|nr:NAD(P)/FAD-dependent oxidoreductase [Azoarcus indigens]NMG67061.1 NAD(P)-binding protein [Azoarcus indigens]TDN56085.1 secreted protein [Azoarcus indigens]